MIERAKVIHKDGCNMRELDFVKWSESGNRTQLLRGH